MTTSLTNDVSYKTLTEKAFTCKDSKRLSITSLLLKDTLVRKLLNVTEAKDTLAFLSENKKNNLFPYHLTIEFTETDNPLYEKNDTFYIKNENVSDNPKKSSLNVKPLFLCLTPQQIALDEKITISIQKGESFTEINKIFTGCLIEKN